MPLCPDRFPRYIEHDPKVPVYCLTPDQGGCIHRFFDCSPIDPTGRRVALFRLPFEDRLNEPGEAGQVVVIDLETGEERVVAESHGWEPQLGANVQWGADEKTLIFNDVDTRSWQPQLVKLDLDSGRRECLPGGAYHVSRDGRYAASPSLERMCRTQYGYGVRLPEDHIPRNIGAPDDDGLFVTDLQSGQRRLVLSLAQASASITELQDDPPGTWETYGFHCKWNPQGDRLMFVVRRYLAAGTERFNLVHRNHLSGQRLSLDVLTLKPDGSDVHNALPAACWRNGGHHMNWCPDGRSISTNLGGWGQGLRFARVGYDGRDLRPILQDAVGSGHPTLHASCNAILTDAYPQEGVAYGDGTVPLRWIDLATAEETALVRIGGQTQPHSDTALRVDPHPAWDRTGRWVVFNGVRPNEHTRRVFLADLRSLVDVD